MSFPLPAAEAVRRGPFLQPVGAPSAAPRVFCFSVQAEAEPGVMPRVLEVFAKRSLVPSRWHSDLGAGDGRARQLSIDIQVEDLSPELTDYIARCLRQLHYVDAVLTSEKRPA